MVGLDRLAERPLQSVSVIILTRTEKIVKPMSSARLERRSVEKKIARKRLHASTQIRRGQTDFHYYGFGWHASPREERAPFSPGRA